MKKYPMAALAWMPILWAFFPARLAAVKINPAVVSYEFTTGANAYFGQAGSAELPIMLNRSWRSSFIYTFSADSDYDAIHSLTGHLNRLIGERTYWRWGYSYSLGRLKESPSDSISNVFDFKTTTFAENRWRYGLGYLYRRGFLSFTTFRTLSNDVTGEVHVDTEETQFSYSAHGVSGSTGYEFTRGDDSLVLNFTLGSSFDSTRTTVYFGTADLSFLLTGGFTVALIVQLNRDSLDRQGHYTTFSVAKEF